MPSGMLGILALKVTSQRASEMKVAFDTDVIVASLRSRSGASNALLHALSAGQVEAVASVPMMLEYEAILMRPEQRQATGDERAGCQHLPRYFGTSNYSGNALLSVAPPVARSRR